MKAYLSLIKVASKYIGEIEQDEGTNIDNSELEIAVEDAIEEIANLPTDNNKDKAIAILCNMVSKYDGFLAGIRSSFEDDDAGNLDVVNEEITDNWIQINNLLQWQTLIKV